MALSWEKMEQESAAWITFTGRWRGRRAWVLLLAASLSVVLAAALMWYLPGGRGDEEPAAGATERAGGKAAAVGADAGPEENAAPGDLMGTRDGEREDPALAANPVPTPDGKTPGLVVEFPDPVGGGEGTPPPQGYGDVLGDWVLEMSGSAYGLSNCHMRLEENGKITTPPEYEQVFVIKESEYVYEEGTGSFAAGMLVMVKIAPSQGAVPAEIYLVGQVRKGFEEIAGEFVAEPQGEAHSPYAQRGTFTMRR